MSILGIESCDVGSLPFEGNASRFTEGACHYALGVSDDSANFFEQSVARAFLDKLNAGIVVPALPQFRDMNEMFLSVIEGVEPIAGGYVETGELAVKKGWSALPEVKVIEAHAERFSTQVGSPFQLRICVTGPYTLASFFPYRNSQTYQRLGRVLSEIIENSIFNKKQGRVTLVAVDEPLFGLVDDSTIDRGAEGRESLLASWDTVMRTARSRGVETCIHLHSTSDDLFWDVESLRIVESHLDDPVYRMKATRERLEKGDKWLKASLARTDFDQLIKASLGSESAGEVIADAWKRIAKGTASPETFLEDVDVMKKRLRDVVDRFGADRVALAGPECGLRGFPTYTSALECLRRVSEAT